MGKGIYHCRTKGIDLLMPMVVKGTIRDKNYALVVAFCLAARYQVGIVPGDAVTCLDGSLAAIQ